MWHNSGGFRLRKLSVVMAALALFGACGAEYQSSDPEPARSPLASAASATPSPARSEPEPMPDLTPEPTPNPALPNSIDLGPLYSVISVTDGDTIRVNYRGKSEPVRFIAINTPEVANYGRQGECFGEEASAFTKRALGGKKIHLVSDGMQDDRDRYGRLLRFIFLEDETNFNETLVREGMATFEGRYPMIPEFRAALSVAQDQAMANHRGLWKACR